MIRERTRVQLVIKVMRLWHGDPLKRDAEHRRGDVLDGGIDIDIGSDRAVLDPITQARLDLDRATDELGLDPFAQGRCRLCRFESGDEHRPQELAVLGMDFLNPVEVREHLLHTARCWDRGPG